MLLLAVPIFLSSVSWVAMKVTDSALLGHTGTRYLDAVAVGDLWMSSTGVFIGGGVLGVFCGQALGAGNKRLVGVWLQVSLCIVSGFAVPTFILWALTGPVLKSLGNSDQVSSDAAYYAFIMSLCFPARIAQGQLSQFFSAQKITRPGAITAVITMTFNLVFGVVLVLGYPVPDWDGFGFKMCPAVTSVAEYLQIGMLLGIYCFVFGLHRDCWHGWELHEVTRARLLEYLQVYLPAVGSLASDFWRVSAIGAVAATLGEKQVGVFSLSYRILWICLIFIGALSAAMSIKLTMRLGSGDGVRAKQTATVGMVIAISVLCFLALLVFLFSRRLGMIFTTDEENLEMFEEIRVPLAAMMIAMNFTVLLERIPMAMKKSKVVFFAGILGSWAGQVPLVILCVYYWRKDLVGLYTGVALGYAMTAVTLLIVIYRLDWEEEARQAYDASQQNAIPPTPTDSELGLRDSDEQPIAWYDVNRKVHHTAGGDCSQCISNSPSSVSK